MVKKLNFESSKNDGSQYNTEIFRATAGYERSAIQWNDKNSMREITTRRHNANENDKWKLNATKDLSEARYEGTRLKARRAALRRRRNTSVQTRASQQVGVFARRKSRLDIEKCYNRARIAATTRNLSAPARA